MEHALERIFAYHDILEDQKVKIAKTYFKGSASEWRKKLQMFCQRSGQGKVQIWDKMKRKLQKKIVPFYYMPIDFEIVN